MKAGWQCLSQPNHAVREEKSSSSSSFQTHLKMPGAMSQIQSFKKRMQALTILCFEKCIRVQASLSVPL